MKTCAKVLVVDDEKRICHNVKKILSKHRFEVTEALSAKDALEKMAKESFSLLISDIVMPDMNGLELLKLVKNQWPLTKAVMMTAYASTDTAVKAIRLGALDYIPKPFTPDEFRNTIDRIMTDDLAECKLAPEEKEAINIIDVDIPFDQDEVAKATSPAYARSIGPSDMPVVEVKKPAALENFCPLGEKSCEIYKKLGSTCKVGTKKGVCPQKQAKTEKTAKGPDVRGLIGVDMPFSYQEVVSVTGPEYVARLHGEGVGFVPWETLRQTVAPLQKQKAGLKAAKTVSTIDVDIPFDLKEVAAATGEAYAKRIGPSDMPVVGVTKTPALENFCPLGERVCDIYKKLGSTCKVGTKKGACPQKQAETGKTAKTPDIRSFIAIDLPFDVEETVAVTGPFYAGHLGTGEQVMVPYETLKQTMTQALEKSAERTPSVARVRMTEPAAQHILVIDDEASVNNNIRKILSQKGYQVDQALTKTQALEKIEARSYQLVLLDLRIPEVKGLELLKAIADRRPEARVIIITGYASIETAVETARMGAVDYLNKPFTPNEIRKAAENALRFAA